MDSLMLLGWVALPLIAYVGGRLVLTRTEHARARRSAPDAVQRLAQLHRLRDDGRVTTRGRMSDAVRLAQDVGVTTSHRARQP